MTEAQWPARYEVRVDGLLHERWADWFEGLEVRHEAGETVISGTLRDQPALHGLLERLRDLGLTVTALRRLPPV